MSEKETVLDRVMARVVPTRAGVIVMRALSRLEDGNRRATSVVPTPEMPWASQGAVTDVAELDQRLAEAAQEETAQV